MKSIKVSDINNEAIRKLAEANKAKKLSLVATLPGDGECKLFYAPWGQEIIDQAGVMIADNDPATAALFAELKSKILLQPINVTDLRAKLLKEATDKKSPVRIKIGDQSVFLTKIEILPDGVVLTNGT